MGQVHDLQQRAWENKLRQGFSTDNVDREFNLLYGEIAEAYDAWRAGDPSHLAEEVADIAIYLMGLAEMTGVDLESAILAKMEKNEKRVYRATDTGHIRVEGE